MHCHFQNLKSSCYCTAKSAGSADSRGTAVPTSTPSASDSECGCDGKLGLYSLLLPSSSMTSLNPGSSACRAKAHSVQPSEEVGDTPASSPRKAFTIPLSTPSRNGPQTVPWYLNNTTFPITYSSRWNLRPFRTQSAKSDLFACMLHRASTRIR